MTERTPPGEPPDETVIVTDTATTQPVGESAADPGAGSAADPGAGSAVDLGADSDDTVVLATPDPDDDTLEIRRGADDTAARERPDDDPTAIMGEAGPRPGEVDDAAERPAEVAVKPVMVAPARRRRRTLRPAPVPPGYGGRALLAPGAGAVSTYRVREIPRPPASEQPLATRAVDRLTGGIASVSRRSRRLSILALGGFALSIAVSVTGLVLIVRSVILGY